MPEELNAGTSKEKDLSALQDRQVSRNKVNRSICWINPRCKRLVHESELL
jgi:hypothetical protein